MFQAAALGVFRHFRRAPRCVSDILLPTQLHVVYTIRPLEAVLVYWWYERLGLNSQDFRLYIIRWNVVKGGKRGRQFRDAPFEGERHRFRLLQIVVMSSMGASAHETAFRTKRSRRRELFIREIS